MKGDGHAAERLLLGAPGSVAHDQVSVTEKRFTMIGLTALDGTPVMCILIIAAKTKDLSVEIRIDITITPDADDSDNFFKNSGPGKCFPGPTTYHFRGMEIPVLIRWRDTNKKPFLSLDGHQSRLEIPFLQYINTPDDHWVVYLGVPYGTALW